MSCEIVAKNASHIAKIDKDTIVVVKGSTYSFSVDTHPDSGLVATTANVDQLLNQIAAKYAVVQQYRIVSETGVEKKQGILISGDQLIVSSNDGAEKKYTIITKKLAINSQLRIEEKKITANTNSDITLHFTAGQRTPNATVTIYIPPGISITDENTFVNIIGRGDVQLKHLPSQSIGRVGTKYAYQKVGTYRIAKLPTGKTILSLQQLDLRPANGTDVKIVIKNVKLNKQGIYIFKAVYSTSLPEVLTSTGAESETAMLTVTKTVSDFKRVINKDPLYKEEKNSYTEVAFRWGQNKNLTDIKVLQSLDNGKSWMPSAATIDKKNATATVKNLVPHKLYTFRLLINEGEQKGTSNEVFFYSGKMDIKALGVKGDGIADDTEKINQAITYMNRIGGGTLLFSDGIYNVKTIHLKSNVWLYINKAAKIQAIKGADAPESTWFSDKKYRSGLSPTDTGPYDDPENYMTKQDVGHHYFHNSMFFAEREDNIKIIGNGLITGNGNLVTGDRVMNNAPDNRADKMFTFKLCTNIEIGGDYRADDLWYDAEKDEPYYIGKDAAKDFTTDNMLQIDRAGHFVLLATGTDHINVHNTYFAKFNQSNARDIYDFMACNDVTVFNIYSKVSSDDIVKPGSDCSLGFTRPARNYKVRNIIGDTNCNLFQIGSETADDIMDLHVDNIYVLGANKAGFSISTNDGAHIKDVHLNCGHTGSLHSRSKMVRTFTPFFISISNRGRILGATVSRFKFDENGVKHDELLVTNVNIGVVENIIINGVDVSELYAGSSFGDKNRRWNSYDGSQRRASPIVAGYRLPDAADVEGGLNFSLPNGKHTGYIKNILFTDVHILVKGGNPASDSAATSPELGVGQYNASNLKVQPSYGLWARHVMDLTVKNCSFNFEATDKRYVLFFDDAVGVTLKNVKMMKAADNDAPIRYKASTPVAIDSVISYQHVWGENPVKFIQPENK
ncbi:endopygalactorunase [Lacibacter luteus]|uniref:Endopygalactorunase n=1 Tax=Lacibacter luteus TaxID=2508719 RepID=A0A4Q1CM54_9BACT|nr:endopygalactorunase [Lacibacter luteus]RXK61689.1 endopygalactorunase [Lacibacter luteus]